ncbi:MAG: hypothetical protein WC046_07775, partial [Candidatus Bathyarchaeia archaeon]
ESEALLSAKHYVVEQFNRRLKDNVLVECWIRPRGLVKKASMVIAGLICLNANAVEALVEEEESLRKVSKHRD